MSSGFCLSQPRGPRFFARVGSTNASGRRAREGSEFPIPQVAGRAADHTAQPAETQLP